jgi:hypothetical protein
VATSPLFAFLSFLGSVVAAAIALYSARKTLFLQREMSERSWRERQFSQLRGSLSLLLNATNPDLALSTKLELQNKAICDVLVALNPTIDSHARLERHLLMLGTTSDLYSWRDELILLTRQSLKAFALPHIHAAQ